jgi:predicted dehydrogenase
MSTRHNVLIIGCGNIAGGFDVNRAPELLPLSHAGAFSRHDGFLLLACVDPDNSRRQAFARRWDIEIDAADVAELNVDSGAFDVISICSPTALHPQHIKQAVALRPRVIFCEKPLASDLTASMQLVQDCKASGITLVVNYSRQWDPVLAELTTKLSNGHWGSVRSIIGHYNKGILNNGSHMIDLLFRLVGPLELVATACAQFDFSESDPTVAALLTAVKGRMPVYLNPGCAKDFTYFEMEIVCELGVIRMHSSGLGWQFRDVVPSPQFEGYLSLGLPREATGGYLETMAGAINDIYAYLQGSASIGSMGECAIEVQKLCMQIQHAALMKGAPN